jgi:hypothetical protein
MELNNTLLGDTLIKSGKKNWYIPKYIKENAKTSRIAILRKSFEQLLLKDKRFSGSRTSEIFITLGKRKGEKEIKYYPKVRDSFYSHISLNK